MDNTTLKRIFEFLEEKGEHNTPVIWKLNNNIPLTKEELNVENHLDLSYSKIKSLPKGLIVEGYLDLEETDIASLPKGLEVGGYLNLRSCKKLTSLPKGLKVGRNLYIRKTELEGYTDKEIREMIKPGVIKGAIFR